MVEYTLRGSCQAVRARYGRNMHMGFELERTIIRRNRAGVEGDLRGVYRRLPATFFETPNPRTTKGVRGTNRPTIDTTTRH